MTARHIQRFAIAAMVLAFVSAGGRALAAEPSLRPLDFSPTAMSADGGTVIGSLSSGPVRWTAETGVIPLGTSGDPSNASDVSADGSVIVGTNLTPNPQWPGERDAWIGQAYRWTAHAGMVPLSLSRVTSDAWGVSDDGSVIVGSANGQAYRWTASAGIVGLGNLPGQGYSWAKDISGDGSTVVGWSTQPEQKAFRWTDDTGMTELGSLPGSQAVAVSADGSVIAGFSQSGAFRWTAQRGMVSIGAGGASGISADGSVIVGGGYYKQDSLPIDDLPPGWGGVDPPPPTEAFIWDATHGMRSLRDVLSDLGADLMGWQLHGATAISADGLTIVGSGTDPSDPSGQYHGWIATIPEAGFIAPAVVALGGLLARRRRTSAVTADLRSTEGDLT